MVRGYLLSGWRLPIFFDRLTADNPCFLASIERDYGKGGEQSPPLCVYMVFVQGNMPELLRGAPVFSVL
jgi:hypothetical protein